MTLSRRQFLKGAALAALAFDFWEPRANVSTVRHPTLLDLAMGYET